MACYTFKIGNREFKVSSSNIEGETSLLNFIKAVKNLDSDQIQILKGLLLNQNSKYSKPGPELNRDIPYLIQRKLKNLGVTMHVMHELEWKNLCEQESKNKAISINSNAKSLFLNGDIYVRYDGFTVGDSIHELSHLLLAVMKSINFSKYLNLIDTMYQHSEVQKIAKELKSFGNYSDNYELDFKEESVVRYLEGMIEGTHSFTETININGNFIDTTLFLSDQLKDVVMATFGITEFPGIITFFKSLVSDIPGFGSDLFIKKPMSSIGYTLMKKRAIESLNIHALIDFYTSEEGGKKIEKGICQ